MAYSLVVSVSGTAFDNVSFEYTTSPVIIQARLYDNDSNEITDSSTFFIGLTGVGEGNYTLSNGNVFSAMMAAEYWGSTITDFNLIVESYNEVPEACLSHTYEIVDAIPDEKNIVISANKVFGLGSLNVKFSSNLI